MKTKLEQELANLKQGDHVCLIYENTAEQLAATVPFIIDGLARGERCVYIVNDRTIEEVVQALAAAGVDVVQERQRGALRLLTRQDTCIRTGQFVAQEMIDFIRQAEVEALADGFTGLRQMGDMTWVLGPEAGCERLIEFEALVNQLLANSKTVGLCHYNNSRFDAPCILEVMRTHPLAILGDQFCPNPYYEPPELVLSLDRQASAEFKRKRVAWWIAQLKQARADEQERERALEKLKQSERRLAEAQRVAHIGSWERDLFTNQVTWSDELYRLFDVQADEVDLSYQQFLNRLVPQDVDRIRAMVDAAIRDRRGFSCDYRITHLDGSVHVLHDRGGIIWNEKGEPIRLVGTAQDVTELRHAEQELKRQKMILQTIFDHIPVMINFVDAAGRVQMVNRHWEHVLGWSLEEAQARDLLSECYPDPEYRARVMEYILHPPPGWTDFRTRVRDGRTLDTTWALIVLADGTRIGFGEDITERKQAEQAHERYAVGLQALSRRLVNVQEEERRHLARELHDEFGQVLATITLHLHAVRGLAGDAARPQLDECAKLLQKAGEQVRSLALELRPTMLDTLGLEATLRWLAEQHQQRTGCQVQVVGHLSGAPLSPELAIACFRMVQEALTNVIRHAAARHVWIELSRSESVLELVVRDDGVGFDMIPTQEQAVRRGSLGMLGMRERVEILGGILHVESKPGRGTRIRTFFRLNEASEQPAEPEE
jgi:PAS domain S-box-containing protein